jgi:ATP-dependent Zn protease
LSPSKRAAAVGNADVEAAVSGMSKSEQERRGTCCHEAGHAVVLHAYHVPVHAIFVKFTDAKGWHGCTKSDPTDHRPLPDRLVFWTAGKMAEEHFGCRAHDQTWQLDYGEVASLLDREELTPQQREQLIDEAETQARVILNRNHYAALRVFDWLVEHESIDGDTFTRLMQGEFGRR